MARARFRDACAIATLGVTALAAPRSGLADGGDQAVAQALVQALQREVAQRPALGPVVTVALAQSNEASERARRLRVVGDEAHARAADGLAREWAETGRDLVRTVDAETRAADLRRSAVEGQAQLDRTRALVEEGIARVGRLQAELEKTQKATPPPRTAVEAHDGDARVPAGKPKLKPGAADAGAAPASDGTP